MSVGHFVIFGAMRTGSNLLESYLGQYEGLTCHGELFNPVFFAKHNLTEYMGLTMADRERDPAEVLRRLAASDSESRHGFRLFSDHDPRMIERAATAPDMRKVILTRAPEESYVSLKIARKTGQWKLGHNAARKVAKVRFDAEEYAAFCAERAAFYALIDAMIRQAGQAAFRLDYSELKDADLMAGLARFLGAQDPERKLKEKLARQNPEPLAERVENWAEMEAAIGAPATISAAPVEDSAARPALPSWQFTDRPALICQPLAGSDPAPIAAWLAEIADAPPESGLNRKALNQWLEAHPAHRRFTIVRDPLARAHDLFARRIAHAGPDQFTMIRNYLETHRGLVLPEDGLPKDPGAHRAAFETFLDFLADNLTGKTSQRTDPGFLSQVAVIEGLSKLLPPHLILGEERLAAELGAHLGQPLPEFAFPETGLETIRDAALERKARAIWRMDYRAFGY
ncbi:hypothetical protein ACMA5I_08955 [Paracoccaceae bacterium GXU_MW_L88]